MAELFGVDVRPVSEHLKNIFKTGELTEDSVIRNFRIVQTEGKRSVTYPAKLKAPTLLLKILLQLHQLRLERIQLFGFFNN